MTMGEPDFSKVDEAARLLYSHDQGQEVDPEVWANDTPETERQEYRREAYRYALVAATMNTPQTTPRAQPLESTTPAKNVFQATSRPSNSQPRLSRMPHLPVDTQTRNEQTQSAKDHGRPPPRVPRQNPGNPHRPGNQKSPIPPLRPLTNPTKDSDT